MDNSTKETWLGEKEISQEAMEKRKSINKKILLYGCLPISLIFGIIVVFSVFTEFANSSDESGISSTNQDPLKIGIDSLRSLVGKKVPYENWNSWGSAKTLSGTNNEYWVVFLDKANISFVSEKASEKILFAGFGEQSAVTYLEELASIRKEVIGKHFSSWDGSHNGLTKLIKDGMNDPVSYEHVETTYTDNGDYLLITTSFRGKNAFGAKVLNSITAKVDFDGNVLEIMNH